MASLIPLGILYQLTMECGDWSAMLKPSDVFKDIRVGINVIDKILTMVTRSLIIKVIWLYLIAQTT